MIISMPLLILIMSISALLILPLCQRFGLASSAGLLIGGMLLGSSGLPLSIDTAQLQLLSEYGVFAILFLLGLALNPLRLWQIRQNLLALASVQIVLSAILLSLGYWYVTDSALMVAVFIGLSLSLCSTESLQYRLQQVPRTASLASVQSSNVLDLHLLLAMVLLAVLPLVASFDTAQLGISYLMALLACSTGLFLANHLLLARILAWLGQPLQQGLQLTLGLILLLATVLLFRAFGLSLYLAALFTGILIADSALAEPIKASLKPFKALFLGMFFISIGIGIALPSTLPQLLWVALGSGLLLLIQCLSMLISGRLQRYSCSDSWSMGLLLAGGSELALILIYAARQLAFLSAEQANLLYLVLALLLLLIPLLRYLHHAKFLQGSGHTAAPKDADQATTLLIAGFGRFGQIVARLAHLQKLRFTLIDNTIRADALAEFGIPLVHADASDANVLKDAGIANCRILVLAIDDVEDAMNLARHVRLYYPEVCILARARDRHHAHLLAELGITYIWRETFYAALAMSQQLLVLHGMSTAQAAQQIEKFQQYDQQLLYKQQGVFADQQQLESEQALAATICNLFANDAHTFKQQSADAAPQHKPGRVKNTADDELST